MNLKIKIFFFVCLFFNCSINILKADIYIGPLISAGSPGGWNGNTNISDEVIGSEFFSSSNGIITKLGYVSTSNVTNTCQLGLYNEIGDRIGVTGIITKSTGSSSAPYAEYELTTPYSVSQGEYLVIAAKCSSGTFRIFSKTAASNDSIQWDPKPSSLPSTNNRDSIISSKSFAYFAIIDNSGPTVSSFTMSDTALKKGETSSVTIIFSEKVIGFNSDNDITSQNGNLSNMSSSDNITWTGTFTPNDNISDDSNILTLANTYTDIAGNVGVSSTTANYQIDTSSPSMAISSSDVTDGSSSNHTNIGVIFTPSESITNFEVSDISVTNGAISNFRSSSGLFLATFTPDNEGATTININSNKFLDLNGNNNSASTEFNWNYNTTPPSVIISSTTVSDGGNTNDYEITLEFSISKETSNFEVTDIDVINGSLKNFTGSGRSYSAILTPLNAGEVQISIEANKFTDISNNANIKSNIFIWKFLRSPYENKNILTLLKHQANQIKISDDNLFRNINLRLNKIHRCNKINKGNQKFNCDHHIYDQNLIFSFIGKENETEIVNSLLNNYTDSGNKLHSDWGIWTSGTIAYGRTDNTNSIKGGKISVNDLSIGIDKFHSGSYLNGFLIHKSFAKNSLENSNSWIKTKSETIGSYHSLMIKKDQFFDLSFMYSNVDIDYNRPASNNSHYYRGIRNGVSIQSNLVYSLNIPINKFNLTPSGEVRYGLIKLDNFNESAGVETLAFSDQHTRTSSFKFSIDVDHEEIIHKKIVVKPFGSLGYEKNFTQDYEIKSYYATNPLGIYSTKIDKDFSKILDGKIGIDVSYPSGFLGSFIFVRRDYSDYAHINEIKLSFSIPSHKLLRVLD